MTASASDETPTVTTVRRIIARNLFDPDTGTPPDRWAALDENGSILVRNTRNPFLDGVRVLLRQGLSPDTLVTMQIEGKPYASFEPVRAAVVANLTVSERDTKSVRFGVYKRMQSTGSNFQPDRIAAE